MANYGSCIDWVLKLEDRKLSGITKDLGDGGGLTRFGIAQKKNLDVPDTYYGLDTEAAIEFAKNFYWGRSWIPIRGIVLKTDVLAATLLSFAVNDGVSQAVKLFQGSLGSGLSLDGNLGPVTLGVIAKGDELQIAGNLREAQEEFYRALAAWNPSKTVYLKGWLRRAQAIYPDLPA